MDVRFPNGAKCTFGGYGASFIEQSVLFFSSIQLIGSLTVHQN
jgi:hypothetical protein